MKLVSIPKEKYDDYRLDCMFDCYKWDPQFLDNNTIAKHILVLSKKEANLVAELTEKLDKETRIAEEFLNHNLKLTKPLALPKEVHNELKKMNNYDPSQHIRLMRYDFHPTTDGKFVVSEVNSDVPGGFAESSLMPKLANSLFNNKYSSIDFSEILTNAIRKKVVKNGTIMMVHCTSYSDDRQVMQFLGDKLETIGFKILYAAADHLKFENNEAISILDGNEGKIDGIVRFTPLEWLKDIKPKHWQGYFNTITPSCNHPIAIFAQTKRFPLIWNDLEKNGIDLSTWRELLPQTCEVKDAHGKDNFIFKPACGRVGEKISIKEACKEEEFNAILQDVKKHPKEYLAQKKFESLPIKTDDGKSFHVCLGSYSVEGKHAGFYARISLLPRIDSNAADIPVLIERSN